MGEEGQPSAPAPEAAPPPLPAKKRARVDSDAGDLRRVAEIVMVLSAIGEMRGGREPTAAEKALTAEARERLVELCEATRPRELFSREAVRVVVEDLGLNRSRDPMMGFRPPKMSIAEKLLLTKKKMEEAKESASQSSVFSSPHLPAGFGANADSHGTFMHGAPRFLPDKPNPVALSAGGFHSATPVTHVPALATAASLKQHNETQPTATPAKATSNHLLALPHTEAAHIRLDARPNGPAYLAQVRATSSAEYLPQRIPSTSSVQSTPAAVGKLGQANQLLDHSSVKPEGTHQVYAVQTSHHVIRNQETKTSTLQAGPGNPFMHQPPQALTFVHAPSFFPNHNEIAKSVLSILQQKVSNHPNWIPPSTEYMNKPLNCQICKNIVADVESLLVCDSCEKGTHLKCLQSYGSKGIPKAEWHCPKCLQASNGKPLPPKYGRVTRTITTSKATLTSGGTHASPEKRTENLDSKGSQQNVIANGNSGMTYVAHTSISGSNDGKLAPDSGTVAEVQSNVPSSEMERENGMSVGDSADQPRDGPGAVCTPGTQNESSDKHVENSGPSCRDLKSASKSLSQKVVSKNSCEHPGGATVENTDWSQEPCYSQVGKEEKLPSSFETSASQVHEIRKHSMDEPKELFNLKGTSESKAGGCSRLVNEVYPQATPNGTMDVANGARDCVRPSPSELHAVEWAGDIVQVVEEKTFYQSCSINGFLHKLQDHVLIASDGDTFIPSKLQSLWEDMKSGSKWAIVDTYYFPSDLPGAASQPSTPEDSEVYASNSGRTITAGSISGPCDVLPTDKFREEMDRRDSLGDTNNGLHPIFMCKYYSSTWLNEAPNRVPPHKDSEIALERNKCLKRYFANPEERRIVNLEYARFSMANQEFGDYDSIRDRGDLDPKSWWAIHGSSTPMLQTLALKLLGQVCSSSCCERNWSTYSFIHSMRRNKMTPQRAEDLVFVHTNLRLLSRSPQYTQGETKMWDIGGDAFDSLDDIGVLSVANLSLDEPDLEAMVFTEEKDDDDDDDATL